MQVEQILLPAPAPGTQRKLQVLRFGTPGARPKAYLQAALHADEIPGLLVQHKLVQKLQTAERDAAITGEIVVVPVANPIGSDQHLLGMHQGRYEQGSGVNFNRAYPDLGEDVAEQVSTQLGTDARVNTEIIRAAALEKLREPPQSEDAVLKHTLIKLAIDADIVLDLHCDSEAVLHVYLGTPLWPDARDLPAQLGAPLTLLASVSGGNPFDEACSGLWWALAEHFPQHPIDPACLAATVELRGERDVHEDLAEDDAHNLYRFLQRRGLIAGDAGELPALANPAKPLEGVAMVRSPLAGVVAYAVDPGAEVENGDLLAVVNDPLQRDAQTARVEITSPIDGLLYARRSNRLARPGQTLCRVAGSEPLPARQGKHLLSD
ncbi:MAG: M14 family metallopeptidase [Gammaproteobacteria bacterium]|nr:M14 family metallopeptidase [Gammaproteobacteria bacterium]